MSGRSRAYAWFRDPRWPPAPLFELRARLPPASERPRAPPGFLYAGWSKGFMGATEGGFMLGVDLAVPGGDRTTTYPPIKATGPVACLHCGTRTLRHTDEVHRDYTGHYCCGEPGCDVTDATHAIDAPDVELETR